MKNCIFCEIAKKEIPAKIVFENKDTVAFLDINPVKAGHTLIIPKRHYDNLLETPEKTALKVFAVARKMMVVLKKAFKADYVTLGIVGKDVPHLHIHLIPRFLKDKTVAEKFGQYKKGELDKIAKKIISTHKNKK